MFPERHQTAELIEQWKTCPDKRTEIRNIFTTDQYKYYKWWHHRDLITEEFVVGVDIDEVWYYIFSYGDQITVPFIHAHADKAPWGRLCYRRRLSDDFIREFAEHMDWFTLVYYGEGLSRDIIEEFGHLFDDATWETIYDRNYYDFGTEVIDDNA
jgi:hypothetical protein